MSTYQRAAQCLIKIDACNVSSRCIKYVSTYVTYLCSGSLIMIAVDLTNRRLDLRFFVVGT